MTTSSAEQEARPRPLGWVVSVVLNVVIGAFATLPFALLATTVRNVVLVPLRWAQSDPAWSDPSGAQALVAVVLSAVAVAVFVALNLLLRRVFRLPARPHWTLATVLFVGVSLVQLLRPIG